MATLSIKLADKDRESVEKAVKDGYAINISDFIRLAIHEKLDRRS